MQLIWGDLCIFYNYFHKGTDLQVDNGAKLAEMLIEFADIVELWRNLPNKELGVGREISSFVVTLVVGFVEVWPDKREKRSIRMITDNPFSNVWRQHTNTIFVHIPFKPRLLGG